MFTLAQNQIGASRASSRFYHAFHNWNASLVSSYKRPLHTCLPRKNAAVPDPSPDLAHDTRPNEDTVAGLKSRTREDSVKAHDDRIAETSPDLANLRKKLISTMRSQTQPVALITSGINDPKFPGSAFDHDFGAMTISSFTTVTLSKNPMVSFNIKMPSKTQSTISRKTKPMFRISLLKATPTAALIAHLFTQGEAKEAFKTLEYHGIHHEWPVNEPVRYPNAAFSELLCELSSEIEVGDHHVIVAKVLQVNELSYDRSLCYENLKYHKSGPALENLEWQWAAKERTAEDIRYLSTRIQEYVKGFHQDRRTKRWKSTGGIHGVLKALKFPQGSFNETDLDLTMQLLNQDPIASEATGNGPPLPKLPKMKSPLEIAQLALEFMYSPEWQSTGEGHPTSMAAISRLVQAAGLSQPSLPRAGKIRARMISSSAQFRADVDEVSHLLRHAREIIRQEVSQGESPSALEKMCEENVWFDQRQTYMLGVKRLKDIVRSEHPETKKAFEDAKENQPTVQQIDLESDDADTQPALQQSDAEIEEAPDSPAAQQLVEESQEAKTSPDSPHTAEEIEEAETLSEEGEIRLAPQEPGTEAGEVATPHVSEQPISKSENAETKNV